MQIGFLQHKYSIIYLFKIEVTISKDGHAQFFFSSTHPDLGGEVQLTFQENRNKVRTGEKQLVGIGALILDSVSLSVI